MGTNTRTNWSCDHQGCTSKVEMPSADLEDAPPGWIEVNLLAHEMKPARPRFTSGGKKNDKRPAIGYAQGAEKVACSIECARAIVLVELAELERQIAT